MRKLILISAFVLASVSAQAGESRSLIVAANDTPATTETTTTTTTEAKPEAAPTEAAKPEATTADTAKPEAAPKQASKPVRKAQARRSYEGDESKARRIAARYGVYW